MTKLTLETVWRNRSRLATHLSSSSESAAGSKHHRPRNHNPRPARLDRQGRRRLSHEERLEHLPRLGTGMARPPERTALVPRLGPRNDAGPGR